MKTKMQKLCITLKLFFSLTMKKNAPFKYVLNIPPMLKDENQNTQAMHHPDNNEKGAHNYAKKNVCSIQKLNNSFSNVSEHSLDAKR